MAESDLVHGLLDALDFAAERHRDQRRKGVEASPYINHPIRVARLLVDVGNVRDSDTLIAAILHDTIEDTETTAAEIESRFGPAVRRLVEEVTDDKRLPQHERKRLQVEHASALSSGAKLIKIADKIANVEDVVIAPPRDWSRERRVEYLEWSEAVVGGCRGIIEALDSHWDSTCEHARDRLGLVAD